MPTVRVIVIMLVVVLVIGALPGCGTLEYYGQAVRGQMSLWWQRESVDALLADEDISPQLRRRLSLAREIRVFASEQLALPDNNSYRYYVDIQHSYVVWNVFAAEEFSVEAKAWCFPVAGCVQYRGYFSRDAAERFAAGLRQQGFDTYVTGVSAYSTLGWFDDPLLSTFLHYGDTHLAGLLFHELAHQLLYVPGDTRFNESFATAVELEGVRRWLRDRGEAVHMQAYLERRAMQKDFVQTLLKLRIQLAALYDLDLTKSVKRERKRDVITAFIADDYQRFAQRWGNTDYYDRWVDEGLDNAKLATLSSYHQWVPAFEALLTKCEGDLSVFYDRARELAALDSQQRREQLQQMMPVSALIP